jgi:Flp pilus assembly pilin Flp
MKNTTTTTRRGYWISLHRDEEGAVSLETVLIIGAIALPILIFLIKVGWPMIKAFFTSGLQELQQGATDGEM